MNGNTEAGMEQGRPWTFIDAYSPRVQLQQGGPQQPMGLLGSGMMKNAGTKIDNIVDMLMEYERMTIDLM